MNFTDLLMKATVAGARSVVSGGWMREECESAALERLVRQPCLTSAIAYRQGKLAAIDELRSLTHHRRKHQITSVVPLEVFDEDKSVQENESQILTKLECEDILHHCSLRVRQILLMLMAGYSQEEIAKKLEVSSSRISQLISRDARRLKPHSHLWE